MFPIYIERPQTQLSLSDYIHLQALLAQEQAEREHRLLQEYKKQQEQRRIQRAMHKLQVLTELQRRRQLEEQAIAAYYEAKEQERKRQLLERQRQFLLQQQQQEYYAALRHKQQQELQDQYLHWASGQKSANDINPNQALAASKIEHQESESEEEEEDFYHDQLASLVRLIFGAQECKNNQKESKEKQPHAEQVEKQVQAEQESEEKVLKDEEELSDAEQEYTDDEEEEGAEEVAEEENVTEEEEYSKREQEFSNNVENKPEGLIEAQDQVMTLDEFVEYIHNKAQSLDDNQEEEEVPGKENSDAMEDDNTLLAMEHIDDNESMDEEVQVPSLVRSEAIHDLVNEILTNSEEEFTQFPDEDPVKIAKYDALNRIEQELNEIRQKHENNILNATLDFSKIPYNERSVSPDTIIAATTVENRELLNYEDQVMKILLKLDMINSDGDESIRNERKILVKRAEEILDKLDEFKLKEWEKASCGSNSCIDEEL